MRVILTFTFSLAGLTGCIKGDAESAFAAVARIDVSKRPGEVEQQYYDRIYEDLHTIVDPTTSVPTLKTLAVHCERARHANRHSDNAFCDAREVIVYRLAKIRTDDAIRTLIELRRDRDFHWDGGGALGLMDAIFSCGHPAIPQLEKWRREEPDSWAGDLIDMIRTGVGPFGT